MGEDKHEVILTSSGINDWAWELQTVTCDERNNLKVVQIEARQYRTCINISIDCIISNCVGGITDVCSCARDIWVMKLKLHIYTKSMYLVESWSFMRMRKNPNFTVADSQFLTWKVALALGVGDSKQDTTWKLISAFPGLLSSANESWCRIIPDWGVAKVHVTWLLPLGQVLKPQYSNYLRKFCT